MSGPSETGPLRERKAECRSEVRRRLAGLDEGDRLAASRDLVDRLMNSQLWRRARGVLLFVPIGREPDLRPAIEAARSDHKTVLLPRSIEDPPGLEIVSLGSAVVADLPRDPLGVPAPDGPAVALASAALDLVLVPGLAFDGSGGRLGRGGGFYDRLLESLGETGPRPSAVGVCFACQVLDRVPRAMHDRAVDAVCTERSMIEARTSAGDPSGS